MVTKRESQLLFFARLALQRGNEHAAATYYGKAGKLAARRRLDRQRRLESRNKVASYIATKAIESILGAGYVAAVIW